MTRLSVFLNSPTRSKGSESHYYILRGELTEVFYGDKIKAISDYSLAIAKENDSFWAYQRRAHAYTDLNNYRAKCDYDKIIELSPGYEHFYYADRGKTKEKLGDYLGALEDFLLKEEKRSLSPDDLVFVGDLLTKLHREDQANSYYKKALHGLLKHISYFNPLKNILTRLKNNSENVEDMIVLIREVYNKEISKSPKLLAFLCCQKGHLDAYCRYYGLAFISVYRAHKLDENNSEYINLLNTYERLRKEEKR